MPKSSPQLQLSQANQILEKTRPKLLKLTQDSLLQPRVTPERANQLTAILLHSFETVISMMEKLFKTDVAKEHKELFQHLEDDALGFYASALALENDLTSKELKELRRLTSVVAEHDDYLMDWLRPVFRDQADIRNVLEQDILPGRGRRDSAEDVLRLCQISQENKKRVLKLTPITATYLKQAETDATNLLQLLDRHESVHPPKDTWRRAYTLWANHYTELCEMGRFLTRNHPERMTLFPSISMPRKAKTNEKSSSPTEQPSPSPAEPT